ncbi:unnamed protein product, partial [marine sediment metagenome]
EREEDVKDLSVEEAYSRRRNKNQKSRRKGTPTESARSKEVGALRKFAGFVFKRAEALIDLAGFAEPADAEELLLSYREAAQRLEQLVLHLERQAQSRSSEIATASR